VRTVLHIGYFLRLSETIEDNLGASGHQGARNAQSDSAYRPGDQRHFADKRLEDFEISCSDGDVHDCRLLFGKSISLSVNLAEATHATPMPVG
jgi:hypothetical protein